MLLFQRFAIRCSRRATELLQILAIGSIVCGAQHARAQAIEAAPNASEQLKTFSYADLLKLRSAQDVQISPDGRYIAFVVSSIDAEKDDSMQSVWMLRVSDRLLTEIAPFPSGSPIWSPDSSQLALVTTDAGGTPTITLVNPEMPSSRRVLRLPSQPGSLTWSPDRRFLAMLIFVPDNGPQSFLQKAVDDAEASLQKPSGAHWAAPVAITQSARYQADGSGRLTPGHEHIFLLSTESGEVRQLTSGASDDSDPSWLPDSGGLLFASDRRPNRSALVRVAAIQRVSLRDGSVVQVSHGADTVQNPTASPDGRWIAYTSSEDRHVNYSPSKLYLMRADGSGTQRLAPQLHRDVYGKPRWSTDGRSVYATFIDHGLGRVGRFDPDGSVKEVAAGTDLSFSMSLKGDLAYAGSTSERPADVRFVPAGGKPVALTSLNSFLQERHLGSLRQMETPSKLDGAMVESWLLMPPGAPPKEKVPVILELHGGPFGFDDPGWASDMQLYAAAGYAVVFTNYRGSTSYGYQFSEPANRNFPGCAYDDVMSVIDSLVQQGIADPHRLFVTGGSAGGELTTWIIGKTNRFQAAVAYKPVINELSDYLESDQYLQGAMLLTPPWSQQEAFWARSPLSLVGSVATPTLLITGDQDRRTPLTETLQYYNALQLRGVPAGLITVPGASHEGLRSRPSQLAAETAATLAWFAHYDPGRK